MDTRTALIKMLQALLREMDTVQSGGAGYYTCIPFARRFNKLLGQARALLGADSPVIGTFDDIEESDPKDPADKSKVLQGIHIEIVQLITLLEAADDGGRA
jgi:ribosome-associated protein YbcJ (S4-like RNA binding protein)